MRISDYESYRKIEIEDLLLFVPYILQLPIDPLPPAGQILSPGEAPGYSVELWRREFFAAVSDRDWLSIAWNDLYRRFQRGHYMSPTYPIAWDVHGDPLQDRITRAALRDFATHLLLPPYAAPLKDPSLWYPHPTRDCVQAQLVMLCSEALSVPLLPAVHAIARAVVRRAEAFAAYGPQTDPPYIQDRHLLPEYEAARAQGRLAAREALADPLTPERLDLIRTLLPASLTPMLPAETDPPERWIALAQSLLDDPGTPYLRQSLRSVAPERAVEAMLVGALLPLAALGEMQDLRHGMIHGFAHYGWPVTLWLAHAALAPSSLAGLAPAAAALQAEVATLSGPAQAAQARLLQALDLALQGDRERLEPDGPLDPIPRNDAADAFMLHAYWMAHADEAVLPGARHLAQAAVLIGLTVLTHGMVIAFDPAENPMDGPRVILDATRSRRQAMTAIRIALMPEGLALASASLRAVLPDLLLPVECPLARQMSPLVEGPEARSAEAWMAWAQDCLKPWAGLPMVWREDGGYPERPCVDYDVDLDSHLALQPELVVLPPMQQLQLMRIILPIATAAALQALES